MPLIRTLSRNMVTALHWLQNQAKPRSWLSVRSLFCGKTVAGYTSSAAYTLPSKVPTRSRSSVTASVFSCAFCFSLQSCVEYTHLIRHF
jgi:hypothetical protein